MVEWLQFSLRAWDPLGHPVAAAEFLDRLTIHPSDPAAVMEGPGVPRVRLFASSIADIPAGPDRHTDFEAAVRAGLLRAAEWLERQPAGAFVELRSAGRVTDVFVSGWIQDDQFDLDLPPEFLRACGALGLTVTVCTND